MSANLYTYSQMVVGWPWLTMGRFFCFTLMLNLGKLLFPRMLRSYPLVIKNGVSSLIHQLDCVLTMIFPKMLVVPSVKPQYKLQVFNPLLHEVDFQVGVS